MRIITGNITIDVFDLLVAEEYDAHHPSGVDMNTLQEALNEELAQLSPLNANLWFAQGAHGWNLVIGEVHSEGVCLTGRKTYVSRESVRRDLPPDVVVILRTLNEKTLRLNVDASDSAPEQDTIDELVNIVAMLCRATHGLNIGPLADTRMACIRRLQAAVGPRDINTEGASLS